MKKYKVWMNCTIIAAFVLSLCILHPNITIAEDKDPIYGELVQKSLDLKIQCIGGLTVDLVSDCPSPDKCLALRNSGNNLLQCVPSLPLNILNGT
ncbi:MAG: hypothetical protein ACM3JQ_04805 [Candidatus Eiseniibacteriota bacterium]